MMDTAWFRRILAERKRIHLETEDEWDFGIQRCWDQLVDCSTRDLPATLAFIERECTDEELYWMSEVFDDIVEATQSEAFLRCVEERLARVESDAHRQVVRRAVDIARGALSGGA